MGKQRNIARLFILTLALASLMSSVALMPIRPARAQTGGSSWNFTGSLNTGRTWHTATLLSNGKVLIAGGGSWEYWFAGYSYSAELYDPASGAWSYTGSLRDRRGSHSATLLQNGQVLVVGGIYNPGAPPYQAYLKTGELYNPVTGSWRPTGSFIAIQGFNSAILLPNGKVLAVGSSNPLGGSVDSAELYNPATGTWSSTDVPATNGSMTLLPSGKVLRLSGTSAELYDPATERWASAGGLSVIRGVASATLLQNGKVLVTGCEGSGLNIDAELYDPNTGTSTRTGNLKTQGGGRTTLLSDGRVLMAGGYDESVYLSDNRAELYDPATGIWSLTNPLNLGRQGQTTTLLPDGRVLVAGGNNGDYDWFSIFSSAELYTLPANLTPNQIDDTQFFIRQQYRDFFGREPDAIGFQNWTDTLTKCANGGYGEFENPDCDRVHVSAGFFQSHEFQGRGYWILRFGFVGLNRSIGSVRSSTTYAEFLSALQKIGGSNSPAQEEAAKVAYTNAFVQRSDFQALFPAGLSNSQYVNGLESNAGVTLNNKQALIDGLNNMSMTRADVLRNVVESQVVFDKFLIPSFVTMEYFGYLRRDVDEVGYRNWVDTLTTDPGNYRHMIFGFIYSTEYRARFGQP